MVMATHRWAYVFSIDSRDPEVTVSALPVVKEHDMVFPPGLHAIDIFVGDDPRWNTAQGVTRMPIKRIRRTPWPRTRLQLRSIISLTMVIGWIWVAASALIPYFLVARGQGAGATEVLGVARSTWMSMHVWSSITIGLFTIGHAILNRRGLYRSARILSGTPAVAGKRSPPAERPKRGFAWAAALVAVAVVTVGSVGFAAADDHGSGAAGTSPNGGVGRGGLNAVGVSEDLDDSRVWESHEATVDHEQGSGSDPDGLAYSADGQRRRRGKA